MVAAVSGSTKLFALQRFPSLPSYLISAKTIIFPARRRLGFFFRGCRCGGGSGHMVMEARTVVNDRIDITEKEDKIFRRLLDVVDQFKLNTQLRVAGGWVRDKLLGNDCYDIDIALDNMLGREFCEKMSEYLQSVGEEEHGKAVIPSNPDQSKHLETARMRIYDTWIDFVNLRSETYAENSRIPTMKFGTAKQDAFRRDLTINSLFYNINSNSVEDLTGRGIQDLKDGYIVTPLPPRETFLDDPLRVLRAIRFGARFKFKLDEDLREAASSEEVKEALMNKISRERIGHEVDLMISGNQPVMAMLHILELKLFDAVFTCPENPQPEVVEGCERFCISYLDAAWNVLQLINPSLFDDEQRRIYFYAALFLPLRNVVYMDNSKKIAVTSFIIRSSLKLKTNDAEMVSALHLAAERFLSLILLMESDKESVSSEIKLQDDFLNIPPTSAKRVLAGMLLREIKTYWRVALLISTLLYSIPINAGNSPINESERRKEIFIKVEKTICDLGLDNIWKMKPLLDGRAIMSVLQLKGGGPIIGEWQQRMLKWQLVNPKATEEECIDWMKQSQVKRAKLDCCI
ncbi:hypothetical protein HPP92_003659 [Vanilla planifolia]|uniref:Poly A polymerase head domain-containing protein n=1 Tax=Vanilla planifolia TaxID=51239 RepID=A0A835VJ41_VANPL|nr:hypothetical protein HPP92_003659 [Vanilla planifolia]